MFGNKFTKGAN